MNRSIELFFIMSAIYVAPHISQWLALSLSGAFVIIGLIYLLLEFLKGKNETI